MFSEKSHGIHRGVSLPRYLKYGLLGFLLSHESMHAFFAPNTNGESWMSPGALEQFHNFTRCFSIQYSAYDFLGQRVCALEELSILNIYSIHIHIIIYIYISARTPFSALKSICDLTDNPMTSRPNAPCTVTGAPFWESHMLAEIFVARIGPTLWPGTVPHDTVS